MKEKILEIIEAKAMFPQSSLLRDKLAAEIEAHVFKFIEWFREKYGRQMKTSITEGDITEVRYGDYINAQYTLNELYNHWLTNIKENESTNQSNGNSQRT